MNTSIIPSKHKFFLVFVILIYSLGAYGFSIRVCQNCHGKNFEKRALGKSKIVKNMKKKDIIKALKNFKTSNSISIMKSFASRLSDKEINQIGNVIGK